MLLTVAIIARNEEKSLPQLLESLKKQDYKEPYDLLLVDGMSKDRTVEIAKNYGCRVVVQKKLGISNARNLCWQRAKGDVVVYLEADHYVDPDFLRKIAATVKDKKVLCARWERAITEEKNWIQKALGVQVELATRRQKAWEFPTIFRKQFFKKFGGYDETVGFAEDRELPMRIKKKGHNYKTVLIKGTVVYAKPVDSLEKLYKEGRWYGRNIFEYFGKTRDWVTLFGLFVYASIVPAFVLGFVVWPIWLIFLASLGVLFLYSLQGFLITGNPYGFLMIPVNIVRGFGEFVGLLESAIVKNRGKIS